MNNITLKISPDLNVVDMRHSNSLPSLLNEFEAVKQLKNEAEAREKQIKAELLALTDGKEGIILSADGRKMNILPATRSIPAKAAYVQSYLTFNVSN